MAQISVAQQNAYYARLAPASKITAQKTGIPSELLLAWWSWETNFGTNQSSKYNNHAGIKKNSKGSEFVAPGGMYAGYRTVDAFANDFARTINLNFAGYPGVISAGRTDDYGIITKAMNASAWAEHDYNVTTINNRAKVARAYTGGTGKPVPEKPTPPTSPATCPTCKRPL